MPPVQEPEFNAFPFREKNRNPWIFFIIGIFAANIFPEFFQICAPGILCERFNRKHKINMINCKKLQIFPERAGQAFFSVIRSDAVHRKNPVPVAPLGIRERPCA